MFFSNLITFVLFASIQAPTPFISEKIEAQVGQQIITSTDLALAEEQLKSQLLDKKSPEALKKMALDRLVDQALIKEYLRSSNMEVSDQDVERQLNSMRAAQGIASMADLKTYLENQGSSFAALKNQIRNQMEMSQFYQVLNRQSLRSLTENDLMSYYQRHQNKFSSNFEIEVQECFIPLANNEKAAKSAQKKYESNPKIFSECVEKISVAPSKMNNGRLGSFRRGDLRSDVEVLIFSLEKNQIASIPQPGGIQLLKVIEKKDLGPKSFEEAKEEIKKALEAERLEAAREKVLSQLRSSTLIKIDS
jgi:parvulin-like peptidyl-prolyl isomerase